MKASINMMPPSLRRQQLLRRRAVQWGKVILALFACGWGIHWYLMREQETLDQRLSVLAREHQPTQAMLQQLIDMREQLTEIEQQESVAKELEHQRYMLAVLGIISEAARRTDGRLRVTKLEVSDYQNRDTVETAGTREAQGASVLLTGVALDNPSVAELLDGLQDSGLFRRVELLASKERAADGARMRDYELRCDL